METEQTITGATEAPAQWVYAYTRQSTPTLVASTGRYYSKSTVQVFGSGDVEGGQVRSASQNMDNNFFRSALWSPDGSFILTASNDDRVRLFPTASLPEDESAMALRPDLEVYLGEAVIDTCWYPHMTAQEPSTCCYLTTTRDHPVQLWDTTSTKLRSSYTIMDDMEQIVAPTAIAFSLDGSKIYGCCEGAIYHFDTSRPGQRGKRCPTTPTRKSKSGQKGLLSCITFNPDHSGVYAVGSFNGTIGFYTDEMPEPINLLSTGSTNGITQVEFSPCGRYLYSSARRSGTISSWDIRNTGGCLWEVGRDGGTNQRLYFSISSSGTLLAGGDRNGNVKIWDQLTSEAPLEHERLSTQFKAHDDCVSAAQFHRSLPILATVSGQRHYPSVDEDDEEENGGGVQNQVLDKSLKLWHMEGAWELQDDPAT